VSYFFDTEQVWVMKESPFYTGLHLTRPKLACSNYALVKKKQTQPFHYRPTQYSFLLGWRQSLTKIKNLRILWDQQIHFPLFGKYIAGGTSLKKYQKKSLRAVNRGIIFKEKILFSWDSNRFFQAYGFYTNYIFLQKKYTRSKKNNSSPLFLNYSSWEFGLLCHWKF
jgi:hypothetical protein